MKENWLDKYSKVLSKVLIYIMCACIIIQGFRIRFLEDQVDALSACFLDMSRSTKENFKELNLALTDLLEAFKLAYPVNSGLEFEE